MFDASLSSLLVVLGSSGSIIDLDVTLFVQLGIFLTIWGIVKFGYFKKFLSAVDARAEGIEGRMQQASRLDAESDQREERYDARIADVRKKAARERVNRLGDAERVERELHEDAERKAQDRLEKARAAIAAELDAARTEMVPHAEQLARDIGDRVLGRKIAALLAGAFLALGSLTGISVAMAAAPSPEPTGAPGSEAAEPHASTPVFSWFTFFPKDKESAQPGTDYGPGFAWALLNFAALLLVLTWILAKPIRQYVVDRHTKVRDALVEAQQARERAEARHRKYVEKLERLERDAREIDDKVRSEARAEANRIIEQAKQRAERLVGETERAVKAEIQVARQSLEKEVARAALAAAEGIVREQLGGEDKRRLEDEYLKQLSG